jgi:GNAT superfamily N-acetyltransferase
MISNLKTVPQFADTVASRGWHAWWTRSGVPLADYRAHLDPMLASTGIPFCLVDHDDDTYRGSCLVIESDLDARPNLTPWIAALWVDEPYRRQGIAAALMQEARKYIGASTVYLCAELKVSPYYLARGWQQIESDVMGLNVFAMATR